MKLSLHTVLTAAAAVILSAPVLAAPKVLLQPVDADGTVVTPMIVLDHNASLKTYVYVPGAEFQHIGSIVHFTSLQPNVDMKSAMSLTATDGPSSLTVTLESAKLLLQPDGTTLMRFEFKFKTDSYGILNTCCPVTITILETETGTSYDIPVMVNFL